MAEIKGKLKTRRGRGRMLELGYRLYSIYLSPVDAGIVQEAAAQGAASPTAWVKAAVLAAAYAATGKAPIEGER